MKTVLEFLEMTPEARAKCLKTSVTAARNAQKAIAKVLVAAAERSDFGKGEMNSYAQRITGVELRREIQGTYEAVNVLAGIRAGKVPLNEGQFDTILGFALVIISGFLSKAPEKVAEACEIAVSGEDVVKRLKSLKARSPVTSDGGSGKSTNEPAGDGDRPKAASTPSIHDPLQAFFDWLGDRPLLGIPAIVERLTEDVHCAATAACCTRYADHFGALKAQAETRWEHLEAESAPALAAAA